MGKEAAELVDALTDLATRMSDEWCAKGDAETKDLDFGAIYDEQAAALIDAAFAKVREECAAKIPSCVGDSVWRDPEYLPDGVGEAYRLWEAGGSKSNRLYNVICELDAYHDLLRAAILGTEAKD